VEITNHWHLGQLLRARRERPCSSAAKQRNEVAPFHCLVAPVLPNEGIANLGIAAQRDPLFDHLVGEQIFHIAGCEDVTAITFWRFPAETHFV